MPGYEIYSEDGTLILRMSSGDWITIEESKLRETAFAIAPIKIGGGNADMNQFIIKQFTDKNEYEERKEDQNNLGVPRADGTYDTEASWKTKFESLQTPGSIPIPDFVKTDSEPPISMV